MEALAKAAPDGYTLAVASTSTYVLTAALGEKKPYNVLTDFTPVAITNDLPLMIASTAQIPPRNLKELIGYLKANHATFVPPAGDQRARPRLRPVVRAGGKGDAVHYKSSSAGIPDLLTGRVLYTVDGPGSVAGSIKEGKLVGMAIFASKRVQILPDVPTMEEAWPEAPDYMKQASVSIILVPAKTPPDVAARLNSEINRAMQDPAIRSASKRRVVHARADERRADCGHAAPLGRRVDRCGNAHRDQGRPEGNVGLNRLDQIVNFFSVSGSLITSFCRPGGAL
jgi:tripartite-type tricarboxylate transporter receptor subunit TctC